MTATVALLMLLLPSAIAVASPAPTPAPPACQTFTRNGAPPPLVRAWFAHSSDERVRLCPQSPAAAGEDTAPVYFGEGPVARHGEVCSYPSHVLTRIGSRSGEHLQRHEGTEALEMALAGAECPLPHAGTHDYIETYDVSAAAFASIMRLWSHTSAAIAAGTPTAVDATGAEVRRRLEVALRPGNSAGAAVNRLVRIPGSVLHHRYALFIKVPERATNTGPLYVIYVDKNLRGPYWISAFAETN